jgi:hypothetical protein
MASMIPMQQQQRTTTNTDVAHAAETDSKPRKRCFAANAQGLVGAKQSRPCVLDQR